MPFYLWPTYLNLSVSVFILFLTLGILWYVWNHRNIPGCLFFSPSLFVAAFGHCFIFWN